MYRQGDVLLRRVEAIPHGLTPVPLENGRVILMHGEVTGHAHAVVSDGPIGFLAADLNDLEQRFLRIEQEAQIVHEEHNTIVLPPGMYDVRRQREYQPEQPVWVAD